MDKRTKGERTMTFWKMTGAVTLGIILSTVIQYVVVLAGVMLYTVLTTPQLHTY